LHSHSQRALVCCARRDTRRPALTVRLHGPEHADVGAPRPRRGRWCFARARRSTRSPPPTVRGVLHGACTHDRRFLFCWGLCFCFFQRCVCPWRSHGRPVALQSVDTVCCLPTRPPARPPAPQPHCRGASMPLLPVLLPVSCRFCRVHGAARVRGDAGLLARDPTQHERRDAGASCADRVLTVC